MIWIFHNNVSLHSDMTKAQNQNLGSNTKTTTREETTPGPRQQQRKHQLKGKKKGKH